MRVKELMSPDPIYCSPSSALREVARLMWKNDCGAIPVCDQEKVVGIVTDRDLVTRAMTHDGDPELRPVGEVMTRNLIVVNEDDRIEHALQLMESEQVRRLPVMDDDDHLVGMISITDLAEHLPDRVAGELLREVSEPPRRMRSAH